MPEFLLELYSEEIPPQLQISARKELKQFIQKFLEDESVKYHSLVDYSSPTRLSICIKGLPEKIKVSSKEVRGPKVGVIEDILNRFVMAHNGKKKMFLKKKPIKENFISLKPKLKKFQQKKF